MHSNRLRRVWLTVACAVGCITGSVRARADMIYSLTAVATSPGDTGVFDVLLTNTGSGSIDVAGFNFEISTSDTDVAFTDITINTLAAPYIFSGDSLLAAPVSGSILESPPSTAQDAQAGDFPADGMATVLGAGDEVGLGHVLFSIAPGATPGPVTIDFGPATSLSDDLGDEIAFDTLEGTLTITGVSATPEPATTGMLGAALMALVCFRKLYPRK